MDNKPDKAVETFFSQPGTYKTDVLIAPEKFYFFGSDNGTMGFPTNSANVWICGGVIYRTAFNDIEIAPVAISLNRNTGDYVVDWDIDFSNWEKMANRVRPKNKRRKS